MNGPMYSLLPVLGEQLVKVEIRPYVEADIIDTIRTHSRSMRTLNQRTHADVNGAHARVLASFGDQLKKTNLQYFDLENVEIVVSAFPNVKVNICMRDPSQHM